ncbi:MAG: hypothetical protein KBG20_22115 [Caldilineaceae bacterium]|nr:hypothetical protein [Caldilineaceae bacterium]
MKKTIAPWIVSVWFVFELVFLALSFFKQGLGNTLGVAAVLLFAYQAGKASVNMKEEADRG